MEFLVEEEYHERGTVGRTSRGAKGFIFQKQYSFVIIIRPLEKAISKRTDKHRVEERAGVLARAPVSNCHRLLGGWVGVLKE